MPGDRNPGGTPALGRARGRREGEQGGAPTTWRLDREGGGGHAVACFSFFERWTGDRWDLNCIRRSIVGLGLRGTQYIVPHRVPYTVHSTLTRGTSVGKFSCLF